MISKMTFVLAACLVFFSAVPADAKLRVLVTLPDFIEVVQAIGGDEVEVDSLLDGTEDPHFVDAVPSFISKVGRADVVCAVGLGLEVGWLPKVLAKSGNAKVQKGGKGFCELGSTVTVIEKITGAVDRSMGDVHAEGNPHFYLSPTALAEASKEVVRVLKTALPERAATFDSNAKVFEAKMVALKKKITLSLQELKSVTVIQFHKEFTYFLAEYGLKVFGAIEDKPGVPPSSARIAAVSRESRSGGVGLAIAALHASTGHLDKFSELSGVPYVKVPSSVHKRDARFNSIEKLQEFLSDEMKKRLAPVGSPTGGSS